MLSLSRAQAPIVFVVLISRAWLVPVSRWTRGTTPPAFLRAVRLSESFAAHSPRAPTTLTNTCSGVMSYVGVLCVCIHEHCVLPLLVDWKAMTPIGLSLSAPLI